MFFTVNGRRIPSGTVFVSMADERHQKAIAKGIGYQVGYNHQNDNRRAEKLVPAKDLAKEERRPAGSEHDLAHANQVGRKRIGARNPLGIQHARKATAKKPCTSMRPHSNGLTESRTPAK